MDDELEWVKPLGPYLLTREEYTSLASRCQICNWVFSIVQTKEKLAQERQYPQLFPNPLPMEIKILGATGSWKSSNDSTEIENRIGGHFVTDVDETTGNPFLWCQRKYKAFTLVGMLDYLS